MFRFVDTHCNIPNILQKLKFEPNPLGFQKFSRDYLPKEFEACISVASDSESRPQTLDLARNVDNIFGAFGIHPLYGGED